jgi:hypothetical protein
MNYILKVIIIGIGATLIVDVWGYFLGLFNIKSLDYRFLGRWIGNFPKGVFFHKNIINTKSVKGELFIGWIAHYLIGINLSFLPYVFYGNEWIENPRIYTGVIFGLVTLVAPLLIMQPAFGFGIASSKLSEPNRRRFKSFLTHLVYGLGLYLTALLIHKI